MFLQINAKQNYGASGIYKQNCYSNISNSRKMLANSKLKADERKQKTQEDETLVLQKNRYKMQTYFNLFQQNNDHMRIMHKMQCCSSFDASLW